MVVKSRQKSQNYFTSIFDTKHRVKKAYILNILLTIKINDSKMVVICRIIYKVKSQKSKVKIKKGKVFLFLKNGQK
jgi:hypothetical protein